MSNLIKQSAAGLAMLFSAAVITPANAREGAPQISDERLKVVLQCQQKLNAYLDTLDTRADGIDLETYYYLNDENKEAIRTALATGLYEDMLDTLAALSQLQSMAAFNLVMNTRLHCTTLSDENGDLHTTPAGREQLKTYEDWMGTLVESSEQMHNILSGLKTEGDKLLANGATPPGFIPLFR